MAKVSVLLVGTDDGVVLLSDPGIGRWRQVGHELQARSVAAVWLAYGNPLLALAATNETVYRSIDGGQTWAASLFEPVQTLIGGGRGEAELVYALTSAGVLLRSIDGGGTWERLDTPELAQQLAVAHSAGQHLTVLAENGTWQSAGGAWQAAPTLPDVLALSASPNGDAVYALANGTLFQLAGDPAMWRSLADGAYTAVAVLPGREEVLLLADGTSIVRSNDGGSAWQAASIDTPLHASISVLVPGRFNIDQAFAGSEDGQLLQSSDRGRTWQRIANDLAPIRAIDAARLA